MAPGPGVGDDGGMPQPRIKRYALVPDSTDGRVRRFHLARVAPPSGSAPGADRLERMEEVAAREHRKGGYGPEGTGPQST
jgi:hypothetical protein